MISLPEIAIVKISHIEIDINGQRDLDEIRVRKIKKAFDVGAIKAVSLMRCEDGALICYDGQHTLSIASESGMDAVPATITNGSRERAGRLFLLLNDTGATKRVAVRDRHRVGINVGDQSAIESQKLVDQFGLKISNGGVQAGHTNAIGAIRRFCCRDKERLHKGMRFAQDLWADQAETWTSMMIRCVFDAAGGGDKFLSKTKTACKKRKVTPRRILDYASAMQSATGTVGGGSAYLLRALKDLSGVNDD